MENRVIIKYLGHRLAQSLPGRRPVGLQTKTALMRASVPSGFVVCTSFRKVHGASKRVVHLNSGLLISFHFPANPRDVRSVSSKTCESQMQKFIREQDGEEFKGQPVQDMNTRTAGRARFSKASRYQASSAN